MAPAVAALLACSICATAGAQEMGPKELPAQVRSIFLAKCSECHGRGLARPRAGLYLHELGAVATNREWVVPYEPEKSYLWILVRDDDMPAKGAKAGPLSAQEKTIIHAWIAAGAPVPASIAASQVPAPRPAPEMTATPTGSGSAASFAAHLLAWLGRFHVVVIHFPIALLTTAALGELLAIWRGDGVPRPAARFCIQLAAATAVAAVVLGWLHADFGGHGTRHPGILTVHRWLGTAVGLWALGVALTVQWDSRHGKRSHMVRILLWSGTALVGATAHFGGIMVHGRDFFNW